MRRMLFLLVSLACAGAASAQSLTITNPPSGANIPIGTSCVIEWTSTGLEDKTVGISVRAADNNVTVADLVLPESGRYEWDIPWECPTASTCRVRTR